MSKWRDEKLQLIEGLEIEFLDVKTTALLVAPDHVNFDQAGNRRSSFTAIEIADIAYGLIQNEEVILEGQKDKKNFYVIIGDVLLKKYKLILKFDQQKEFLYVVTLYRIKK